PPGWDWLTLEIVFGETRYDLAKEADIDAQPPAQPHSGGVVDCPVRLVDGAYIEVVRPCAQRAVQLTTSSVVIPRLLFCCGFRRFDGRRLTPHLHTCTFGSISSFHGSDLG